MPTLASRGRGPIFFGMMNSSLRLASYNIRKCIGLDRRRRPDRIAQVITGLGADIVALQEADRRLGARPAALTPADLADSGLQALPVAQNSCSLGWHGNAILVRPGLTLIDLHRIDLPGLEPRGAVIADLTGPATPLRIVATHLGLTRRHRRQQLDHLIRQLGSLSNMPTVILGDFNEWAPARGLEPLVGGYTVLSPGRSFHAARPIAALDRIAHCERLVLSDAGVVECPLSTRASDHLPIWADLKMAA